MIVSCILCARSDFTFGWTVISNCMKMHVLENLANYGISRESEIPIKLLFLKFNIVKNFIMFFCVYFKSYSFYRNVSFLWGGVGFSICS